MAGPDLDALDVGSTHAAAAVYEEQQLPGGSVELRRLGQQVRTEVQHQNRAAQDVLVVSLPHKLQLGGEEVNVGCLPENLVERFSEWRVNIDTERGGREEKPHPLLRFGLFASAADKVTPGTDLLLVLAEGEPAPFQDDQWAVRFFGERRDRTQLQLLKTEKWVHTHTHTHTLITNTHTHTHSNSNTHGLTTEVQYDLDVSVVQVVLSEGDVGG